MLKVQTILFPILIAIASAGCGGGDEPVDNADPLVDGKADSLAKVGQLCGGFVAHPKQCAAGLECESVTGIPDLPGRCVRPGHKLSCTSVGGECIGLTPKNCMGAGEHVGNGAILSCGKGLGVECCVKY